jgi:hypothetical protein
MIAVGEGKSGSTMRIVLILITCMSFLTATNAYALFDRWDTEVEDDPFSGGKRVTSTFMSSVRSGVLIICDSAEAGLTVRAIPGFEFDQSLSGLQPTVEFAVDGKRLLGETGSTGAVGNNLAISQVLLLRDKAQEFVDAFSKAQKQIAVKDGISDRPHLLAARGSTKAGEALTECIKLQK